MPEKITIDKSGANTAAIEGMRADSGAAIELRQSKYLNNIVEQDHQAIKRIVRPLMGFKSFRCARIILAGIETMHISRTGSSAALMPKLRPQHPSSTRWRFDPRPSRRLRRPKHVRRRTGHRLKAWESRRLLELIAAIAAGKLMMLGRYLLDVQHVEVCEPPRVDHDTIQVRAAVRAGLTHI